MDSISKLGLVSIKFDRDMFVDFANIAGVLSSDRDFLDAFKSEEMILVKLVDESDYIEQINKRFDWEVTEFSRNEMLLYLKFEEPLLISNRVITDKIEVIFAKNSLLFDERGRNLEEWTKIDHKIPP